MDTDVVVIGTGPGGEALTEAHRAGELAGTVTVEPSFAPVAKRVAEQATDHWDDTVAVTRLEDAGATVIRGTGRLDGARRAVITPADGSPEIVIEARIGVVLNPGTRPVAPPIGGLEGTPYWTNREALQATEVPAELIVIGGGPTTVTYADGRFTLTLADGQQATGDRLLVAAGRTPNTDGLGLESVGLDPKHLSVDEWMRAGLVKVVEADGVLVGATAVGPSGGEILAMLALAVHARIPIDTLGSTSYAYPTFHRTIASAIDDLQS